MSHSFNVPIASASDVEFKWTYEMPLWSFGVFTKVLQNSVEVVNINVKVLTFVYINHDMLERQSATEAWKTANQTHTMMACFEIWSNAFLQACIFV